MSPRHRRPSATKRISSSALLATFAVGSIAAGTAAPALAAPATPIKITATAEAERIANTVPDHEVAAVAEKSGVTEAQVRSWLVGQAQDRLNHSKDGDTVVVQPLLADGQNGGLAVRGPFGQGNTSATAVGPGAYAGAFARDAGQSANAFALGGIATATAGGDNSAVECAGVISYAVSSDAGTCVSIMGNAEFRYDEKTKQASVALTDPSQGLASAPGTASRAILEQVGAAGTPLPAGAVKDIARVTFTGNGPQLSSDTGFAGLPAAATPAQTAPQATAPSSPDVQVIAAPVAEQTDFVYEAWSAADGQFWEAVEPVSPGLHQQVTETTGAWAANAKKMNDDATNAVMGLLPSGLQPGNPSTGGPLDGSGYVPAPVVESTSNSGTQGGTTGGATTGGTQGGTTGGATTGGTQGGTTGGNTQGGTTGGGTTTKPESNDPTTKPSDNGDGTGTETPKPDTDDDTVIELAPDETTPKPDAGDDGPVIELAPDATRPSENDVDNAGTTKPAGDGEDEEDEDEVKLQVG